MSLFVKGGNVSSTYDNVRAKKHVMDRKGTRDHTGFWLSVPPVHGIPSCYCPPAVYNSTRPEGQTSRLCRPAVSSGTVCAQCGLWLGQQSRHCDPRSGCLELQLLLSLQCEDGGAFSELRHHHGLRHAVVRHCRGSFRSPRHKILCPATAMTSWKHCWAERS